MSRHDFGKPIDEVTQQLNVLDQSAIQQGGLSWHGLTEIIFKLSKILAALHDRVVLLEQQIDMNWSQVAQTGSASHCSLTCWIGQGDAVMKNVCVEVTEMQLQDCFPMDVRHRYSSSQSQLLHSQPSQHGDRPQSPSCQEDITIVSDVPPVAGDVNERGGIHEGIHEIGSPMSNGAAIAPSCVSPSTSSTPFSLSLFPSLSIQNVLAGTVTFIQQQMQADRVIFYPLVAKGICVDPHQSHILAEAMMPGCSSMRGEMMASSEVRSLLQHCLSSPNRPFLFVDVTELSASTAESWSRHHVHSALVLALVRRNYLVGIFAIHQCHQGYEGGKARFWSAVECDHLRPMLHELDMIMLQSEKFWQMECLNAALVNNVRTKTEQVQTAIEFESALKRITDKVRDSLDEGQILQTAVQELSEVLGLGGCNAALYNLEKGTSTICYEYTNFIAASRGRVAQMNDFPELYNQLRSGLYFQFCSLIPNPKRGRVSLLACPIFFEGQDAHDEVSPDVLGDLWLIHTEEYVFSEFEIRLVQQVANQCAIAIRQARLYQAVQGQVQELERLNRLKDEFLSTVSHELRTPISNVKMAIHMLKNATNDAKRQRYMEILEVESKREADLINDLLDLQKLESANVPIYPEALMLQDWLPRVAEPFLARMATFNQEFRLNCAGALPSFRTDFELLQRIVSELLNNACKYTPGGNAIELTVYPAMTSDDGVSMDVVSIEVSNQAEIAKAELSHVFDKFYRVPHADPWKQGGTGLGLALVKKLVHQLNGTIQVESLNGWTTFTVVVPQQPG